MSLREIIVDAGHSGPGGRDGYIHIDDATEVLRMDTPDISEIAIRLKNFDELQRVFGGLKDKLGSELNKQGKPAFEVHTWEKLSPFFNIARMIDIMTFFIKLMLIAEHHPALLAELEESSLLLY